MTTNPENNSARAQVPSSFRFFFGHLSLTREGWYWLFIAALLLAIGVLKVINLLMLLAYLMIALWALNALLAGRHLRHLRVQRFLPRSVFAGEAFEVSVRVSNDSRGTAAGMAVDSGSETTDHWFLSGLLPGQTASLRHPMILPRRGRITWAPSNSWSGYPFGLARRWLAVSAAEEIIVLPSIGRIHRQRLQQRLRQVGAALSRSLQHPRRHPTAHSEFHGLRAFRSGDSPRWIHWRTSARCGELMVREFEDRPMEDLVLVVDLAPPSPLPLPPGAGNRGRGEGAASGPRPVETTGDAQRLIEEALSLAATICFEWCRQQGDRIVLAVAGSEPRVVEGFTSERQAIRMLEALALQDSCSDAAAKQMLALLAPIPLPVAPILLVRTCDTGMDACLADRLGRPVVCLDVSQCATFDFYERPADHGA